MAAVGARTGAVPEGAAGGQSVNHVERDVVRRMFTVVCSGECCGGTKWTFDTAEPSRCAQRHERGLIEIIAEDIQ